MKFGPQKGHIACIFDSFFKDFGLVIGALAVSLIMGDMSLLMENVFLLIIVLLAPVMRVVGYFTTIYEVDEEKLTIRSGLFTKNILELPLSTITTVDVSQNIFHQIFGVYRLNVDNNSSISDMESKVHMTLRKSDADLVKQLLIKGRQGLDGSNFAGEVLTAFEPKKGEGRVHQMKATDLVLMGLLKAKTVFFLELLGVLAVLVNLIPMDFDDDSIVEAIIAFVSKVGATPSILIGLAVLLVLGSVCGMIGSLVKYYGFKVLDNGEALKIEYGLLNRKSYTIGKKKISGFYYEQSALMRLMHVGVLNLMAVGYGVDTDENTSEEAILFPLLKDEQVRGMMSSILPEMEHGEPYRRPEKKACKYFFLRFSVFFSAAVFIGCFFLPKVNDCFHNIWIIGLMLLIFSLISGLMDYKTTGIYGNEFHFGLCSGGYNKTTAYVKTGMIEAMESSGSILKRKNGIVNIQIECLAPFGESSHFADNMPEDEFEKLKTYLLY